ncbi:MULTISPECIES: DUF4238 domain-containing protein [Pectobacterium]|uniref:DUF4238 domain-containing protein n=1 Tax=Pectobacterium TaxID=122277 RepID=UPI0019699801|nr:DUF4238 domain-containing protein [Pectobacterium carotovorum]MBN3072517.1 DUF4238 domain-containing protein [Pectobacterium brasiliense]MCL6385008.1 DUF4238 domain-containing protein [Pectobacterium carotovorum subsp. carotovorum]GLX45026.1 hypothetical protein Pcaca01_26940 [Pectobacterium carotovorum subsp. carotovorum]
MTKTKNNHYVPQWHQKGFMDEGTNQLCHLTSREITLHNGERKIINTKKWYTSTQRFYEEHLYSTFFGAEINDEIERKLFGPIDDNGSKAVRAFLTDDQSQWHHNFQDLFIYLDAQKLRTPKGLEWIKSKYPELTQKQLMSEMQELRTIHCTLWAEGVRELVSASTSKVKFILSDHPVTVYNYACPPDSEPCRFPKDPDIALKGSQTIFPLDKNRCLILTNLEYAKDPENVNPVEQRTNATRLRRSMVSTINFINTRELTADEVTQINHIIKSRSNKFIAAGREDWLYPENHLTCDWAGIRHVLLPPSNQLYHFSGEIFAEFEDGTVLYQDALGRTTRPNDYLNKHIDEARLGRNELCGCGSGRKYKNCCLNIPVDLRTTWGVVSIRERNLAFCNCINDVLGLTKGKTWLDVKRELSESQITDIYGFYSILWPRETDIYSLLPRSDGKFRGLYSGILDVRFISESALPMASIFDEFLVETPVTNPNIIRPEFSPIESPDKYKYQALKEFLFMLKMEPFIGLGLVNLIPDPSEFDMSLMSAMMGMAEGRGRADTILSEQDRSIHSLLAIEDLLNSTAMMSREARVKILINEFGLDEATAIQSIVVLEQNAEASPLVMLQQAPAGNGGQFMQFRMGPNYEMALLIAQVTGSVLVTDSSTRWNEFMAAPHRNQGIATYPWSEVLGRLNTMPIDECFLDEFRKSQGYFATLRNILKRADKMILDNNNNAAQLALMTTQATDLKEYIGKGAEQILFKRLRVSAPDGGFYDANVQRLLARSSCLKYDNRVRAIFGIGLPE